MRLSYASWVRGIERYHRLIIAGSVVLSLLAALSLTRLRLDIDVLNMLPRGAQAFDDFKALIADFGALDQLIVVVEGAPPTQLQRFADVFAERLAQLDVVASVQSRIDVQQVLSGMFGRYLYNYLSDRDYDQLERRLTPEGIEAQVQADRAILSAPFDLGGAQAVAQDPLGVRRLAASTFAEASASGAPGLNGGYVMARDGSALLLLVRPKQSAFNIEFSRALMDQVHAAEAAARRALSDATVQVKYTGSYVYALEDAATLSWDITRYTFLALAGVLAVFYFGYRSLRILPFVTYPLVLTTLLTFALSLVLFDELNAVSMSFAAILYGLSIDSAIYFYTRLMQERRHADIREAVTATLAGLGRANVAASTTTAAAFLVIGFSVLSAVSQLGLLTALGMVLTTVEFFTLYPALAFVVARRTLPHMSVLETPRLGRVAEAVSQRGLPLGLIAALAMAVLLIAARRVGWDVTLTDLRPHESAAMNVEHELTERFGGQDSSGAVLVYRADLDRALASTETITRQLLGYKDEGLLQSVQSVSGILPSVPTQQERLARYNRLPRAAAVALLRDALARHGFAVQQFSGFFADFERPRSEYIRFGDPALAPLAALLDHHVRRRNGGWVAATHFQVAAGVPVSTIRDRLRRDLQGTEFTVASRALLEDQLGATLRRELAVFMIFGLIGNFILLFVSFWSTATAIAILAPVVLVVITLFAAMWATGIPLDPINLVVTPLLFGLGVDYGVYLVARARERGGIAEALRLSGRAVVVTALATITGFGFLGLSRFPALSTMGRLAALGLFLCLLLSVILLPALLALVGRASGAPTQVHRTSAGAPAVAPSGAPADALTGK